MNNAEFIKKIDEKKIILENAKVKLKEKFIGIDDVIDKIIDNISLWFLTPELQFKPHIVSLWGITGVGKTDLVRTLVKLLGFTDKFIEVQMDMKNDYSKNIEDYLDSSGIGCNEPGILLLDEIQRYRTIDENGVMIENKYFNDIWMLLSDGRFKNDSQRKNEIMQMFLDEIYFSEINSNAKEEEKETLSEPQKKSSRFKTSFWSANRFKKMLNLENTVEEIMEMSLEKRMDIMEEKLKSNNINEGKSYEKLLIFISGNLDEAFVMSDDVEDIETDADIYHDLSKRINIIKIKDALSRKFKPEQIARFGNNHIIYPCLDKKSYYKIIKINCDKILERIKNDHNIDIELTQNVYDIIYRNGVFPTQGVRPVISTVLNLLGNSLPFFLYQSMVNQIDHFVLDFIDGSLCSTINGNIYSKEVNLEIDKIKTERSIDEKILVIVHEIGHALLYSVLFNTPPRQININSTGFAVGFVINHNSVDNKTFIRNQLAVHLGGLVAEELVFGENYKSSGSSSDLANATNLAGQYVRHYAMDGNISTIYKPELQIQGEFNYDVSKTNSTIEEILNEEKKRAKDLLNKNVKLFKELVKISSETGEMPIETFTEICEKNGLSLNTIGLNTKLIYSYDKKLREFLNQ